MFRIIYEGNAKPFSFPVDPSAEFQSGQIAQLTVVGNNVVCGVSDGTAPLGIIDDDKTTAFTTNSINEIVIAGPINGVIDPSTGQLVTPYDVKTELEHANIVRGSFVSDPVDCELIPTNGVVRFLAGTPLNCDLDGDGVPDSIRTVVSYAYAIPNIPGQNTTAGSNQVTVWITKLIGETDQYDTTQSYPINANLYVDCNGRFTSKRPSEDHPGVAIVTGSPSSILGMLQFMWTA